MQLPLPSPPNPHRFTTSAAPDHFCFAAASAPRRRERAWYRNLVMGTLRAHAWLKCADHPANDRADIVDEFNPFAPSPTLAAFIAP